MPRVKRIPGPYRFYFTSFDCVEPPHVSDHRASIMEAWREHCGG